MKNRLWIVRRMCGTRTSEREKQKSSRNCSISSELVCTKQGLHLLQIYLRVTAQYIDEFGLQKSYNAE